jgi:magnesium transporter
MDAKRARQESPVDFIIGALADDALDEARLGINQLHPAAIANLLEALPHDDRDTVWELLDPNKLNEVLAEAEDEIRASRMLQMHPEALARTAQDLDIDDAVDILQDLPEDVIDEVLRSMDEQNRRLIETALAYPEDTAGGLMMVEDFLTVRADVSLEVVLRYLRAKGEIPEKTDRLIVVDRENRYEGMLRLASLLIKPPEIMVSDIMETGVPGIPVLTPSHDVAIVFQQLDLISAPVVDADGRLLGRITFDDVVDVIRDEGEHSFMSMAGMDEHYDMFAPVWVTTKKRSLWLGANLATALLASWVIGFFEASIQQVVALAVLMPVVASMGGIAGSQVLTVVIRGMALGQIERRNAVRLVTHEVFVGVINSVFWAVILGVIAYAWFDNPALGVIVGVALVVNVVVAAFAGALIPLLLRSLSIDPALAGGVILTTVTDVIGFVAFLGLGALFLVH